MGERAAVEKLQQELDAAKVAAERAAEQHTEKLAALEAQRCVLVLFCGLVSFSLFS